MHVARSIPGGGEFLRHTPQNTGLLPLCPSLNSTECILLVTHTTSNRYYYYNTMLMTMAASSSDSIITTRTFASHIHSCAIHNDKHIHLLFRPAQSAKNKKKNKIKQNKDEFSCQKQTRALHHRCYLLPFLSHTHQCLSLIINVHAYENRSIEHNNMTLLTVVWVCDADQLTCAEHQA